MKRSDVLAELADSAEVIHRRVRCFWWSICRERDRITDHELDAEVVNSMSDAVGFGDHRPLASMVPDELSGMSRAEQALEAVSMVFARQFPVA